MFARIKHLVADAGLLALPFSLLVFTVALAASGDLDPTFGGDGIVTSYVVPSNPGRDDKLQDLAIQSDGKIVAVGFSFFYPDFNFALTRYKTDGSLDTTFSGDGRLMTDFGGLDQAYSVAVQADGKIVAVGRKCGSGGACAVALARYKTTCTQMDVDHCLDTTFGKKGKVLADFSGANLGSLGGLAIQSDGKIVVAGFQMNSSNSDFVIYRFNADGTPDTTFGNLHNGKSVADLGGQDVATNLVLQNGKIVVAGYSGDASGNYNFAIARLTQEGLGDTTFSGNGVQLTNFGGNDYAYALARQTDGKIVVVGQTSKSTGTYFAIARYKMTCQENDPDHCLDTTFGIGGRKTFKFTPGHDAVAEDVIVQSNGKIVVFGWSYNGFNIDFALVRLDSLGSFDNSFGMKGKVTVDSGGADIGYAIARQPSNGRYVLGGWTNTGTGGIDFELARVLP